MIVPHGFYHIDLTRKIMSTIDEAKAKEEEKGWAKVWANLQAKSLIQE